MLLFDTRRMSFVRKTICFLILLHVLHSAWCQGFNRGAVESRPHILPWFSLVDYQSPVVDIKKITVLGSGLQNSLKQIDEEEDLESIVEEAEICDGTKLLAHKTNCNHYYQCVNGAGFERSCPPGTVFITEKQNCDWPTANFQCGREEKSTAKPIVTQPPSSEPISPKIICYFTNWALYRPGTSKFLPEHIDEKLCTHVLYAFAVLNNETLTLESNDSWADFDHGAGLISKVTALRSKGIKVLLSLGGWADSRGDKYSRLVNSPEARHRFIEHALQFILKHNFDGLDLDWEYPKCWQVDCTKGPDSDKENFALLVKELSAVFKPKGLLLSAAVSPNKDIVEVGYDVPGLSRFLDWIAVMTYDYHGNWEDFTGHGAPFKLHENDTNDYFNVEFTMNYYQQQGADPAKLIMGIPLYGHTYTLANQTDNGLYAKTIGPGKGGAFFYQICHKILQEDWTVVRDPNVGPYAFKGDQWMSYDDVHIIKDKMEFVRRNKLGGAMIWSLDSDDFTNRCGCGKYPLLRAINEGLRERSSEKPLTRLVDLPSSPCLPQI